MMKEALAQQELKLNYLKEEQENKMRKIQT